jgi:hypothetical protein
MQSNRTIFLCCAVNALFLGIYAAEPVQDPQKACSKARVWQWIGNYYGFPSIIETKERRSEMLASQTPKWRGVSDLPEQFSWIKPWTWHLPKYSAAASVVYGEAVPWSSPIGSEMNNLLIPVVADSNASSGFRLPSREEMDHIRYSPEERKNPFREFVPYRELFRKELNERVADQGNVSVCDLGKKSQKSEDTIKKEQLMQIKEEKSLLNSQQKMLSSAHQAVESGIFANHKAEIDAKNEWTSLACSADVRLHGPSPNPSCIQIMKHVNDIANENSKLRKNIHDIKDMRKMLYNREEGLRQRSRAIKETLESYPSWLRPRTKKGFKQ